MPAKALIIPSIFTAQDRLSGTVKGMGRTLGDFTSRAESFSARSERAFKKLTPGLSAAGKQLVQMAGAAALVGGAFQLGRSSIESIMDYENAVQSFRTIVSDLNDTDFSKYQAAIGTVAKDTKKSTTDVAKSFEKIAGLNADFAKTADSISAVSSAAITLSKASRDDLGTSAENLVGILNQFSLGATESNRVINVLAAGQAVGAASITQTSQAFQVFGAVAKQSNLSLEQSVALTEVLASKQIQGSEAGTALRGTFIRLKASGLGYKSGLFNVRDALEEVNQKYKKLKTAKEKDALLDKVFGTINMTTGSILMSNVGLYDKFTTSVTGTQEAQKAAAINSDTLSNRLSELSNAWTNMLTSSTGTTSGLNKVKTAVQYVTDHLGELLSTGLSVLKFYALWKAANIAMKVVTTGLNIVQGISNALRLKSITLLEGNVVATRASVITEKLMVAQLWLSKAAMSAWSAITAISTGDMIALNVAMSANPIGIVVIAVAALAAGIGFLIFQQQKLREEYEQDLNARIIKALDSETRSVEMLAQRYIKLGMSKEEAIKKSIAFERESIALDKVRVSGEIRSLNAQLREKQVMFNGALINLPGAGAIEDKVIAKEKQMTNLSAQSLALTNYAIGKTAVDQVALDKKDLTNTKISAVETLGTFSSTKVAQAESQNSMITNNSEANATITIKNGSDAPVDVKGFSKNFDIMPNMSSTMSTKK